MNKLLPAAGIEVASELGLPERLKHVQALMAKGDPAAESIYETVGAYLGHALPSYATFPMRKAAASARLWPQPAFPNSRSNSK